MLGAAWIAGKALLPAIDASRNGRIVALASRSPERAREMLAAYPTARAVDSYNAVVEDPDVDAVYIPLVNNLHLPWALRALAAGKHVLCEKPLAMNAAEAEEMAVAATRAERLLMEAFMYRFNPRVSEFVQRMSQPIHVQATFGFTLGEGENYRFDAGLGGGALLDVGCYCVSVSRWILGEPVEVLARAHRANGVDMTTSALLTFQDQRMAALFASFESPETQELTVLARDGPHHFDRPFTPLDDPIGPYRLMVESFAGSIIDRHPAEIALQESIANMSVLDQIGSLISS